MRVTLPVVFALAGFAAAQTLTTTAAGSSASCAAQNIVDACLSTQQPQVTNCPPNDWKCLCDAQTQLVTCYNNCPNDPAKIAAGQQQTSWCNAAAEASSQSALLSSTTSTNSGSTSATSAAPTTTTSEGTFTTSGGSTKASSTGAAANVHSPIGGIAAVLLGLIALF